MILDLPIGLPLLFAEIHPRLFKSNLVMFHPNTVR